MKKKVLLFSLTLVLLASLVIVGCTTETPTGPGAPQQPEQPEQPTGPTGPGPGVEVIRLKFADWDPALSVFCRTYREPWALAIEDETDGRVIVDVYGSETLVKTADLHDALLTGIADIVLESPRWTPGRFPLAEMSHLPIGFRSSYIAGLTMLEAYETGLFADEYTDEMILNFRPNDVYNLIHRTKYVKTLEDWQGQKIAGSGAEAEVYKMLGAIPVALGPAETYDALAKGMIDMRALEWEGQYIWKTYEVTKYRTDKCDLIVGAATHYAMSLDSYAELPADLQAVFDKYAGLFLTELTSANMDRENEWRRTMIVEHDQKVGNPEFYNLPDSERQRWLAAIEPVFDDYIEPLEAKGLPARACYEGLKALAAKYEAMYPPLGEAHLAKMLEYGYEAVYPGWPPDHPAAGFEWLYERTGTTP